MPTAPNISQAPATDADALRAQRTRYQRFLQQDPDNRQLLSDLAELNLKLGEFDAAKELLHRALTRYPGDNNLQFRLATVCIAANEGAQALSMLQQLFDAGLDVPALRYNLAYAALLCDQPELARESLEAIADSAETPGASLLRAKTYHRLGDVDLAISHALAAQPRNPEVLGTLALLCFDAEKKAEAKAWAEQALQLQADNHEALVALGLLALSEQDIDAAERHFQLAGSRHARSGQVRAGLGLVHMARMELDKAVTEFKRYTECAPDDTGAWHSLAWAQLLSGDKDGCEQSLRVALAIDPDFGETHGGLAIIAALRGNHAEAERSAKIGLQLDPNSYCARFAQSLLTAARGDREKAGRMVEDILKSQVVPGSPGDNKPLLEQLQRLQKFNPRTKH